MSLFSTNKARITTKNYLYLWQYSTQSNLLYEHSSGKPCVLSNLTLTVTSQLRYCSFDLSLSLPVYKIICQQTLIWPFCKESVFDPGISGYCACLSNKSLQEFISFVGEHSISKLNNLSTILAYLTPFHRSVLL